MSRPVLDVRHARYARTALAAGLVAVVAADDAFIARVDLPVPLLGPADWVGHLATTGVALLAMAPRPWRRHARMLATVAVASVAIDVDHIPLYLHLVSGVDGGRPVTHSLVTPALLVAAGLAWPRRRRLLLAAAAGVGLHFVRDIATGPGLSLLAPFSDARTLLPWASYAAVLVALVAVVALRDLRTRVAPVLRLVDGGAERVTAAD
jgi:inner membrane protein